MCRVWQVCWLGMLVYWLLSISVTSSAVAANLILSPQQSVFSAAPVAEYLEDDSRKLTFQQITSQPYSDLFQANQRQQLSFGNSHSAWWVRFQVQNQSELAWYLLVDAPLGDEFDLYILPQAAPSNQVHESSQRYAKPVANYMRHAWSLNLPKDQTLQVYMRVTNGDAVLALPINFVTADEFVSASLTKYRLVSFVYAGLAMLALYQLFMFFSLRKFNYLLLTVFIAAMAITIHRSNPVFSELSFLSRTGAYFYSAPFYIMVAAHAEFIRRALDMKYYAPKLNILFKVMMYLSLGLIFITGAIPAGSFIPLVMTGIVLLLSLGSSYYIASKGNRLARYFAWVYWIPLVIYLPSVWLLLFDRDQWVASLDNLAGVGTLLFMLMISVLYAERVRVLREKMKQVEAASIAKEQFLAVMSHELRTPIHAIVGLTTLLKLDTLSPKQEIYISKLESATDHVMQLINHVLDYAKLSSSTFKVKPEACKLSLAIQATLPLIQQQADQKGLAFKFESKGNIEANLIFDRTCLTQVLLNLLTNAVKYTDEGSITLSVKVSEIKNSEQVVSFVVSDTGSGIAPEYLAYLFEPYTQLTSQNVRRGVGLGLAISKHLVAAMGSTLNVQSQLGKGSSFSFELNLATVLESNTNDSNPIKLASGLRLLVADNAELNHPEASDMLRQLGAEVKVVANGQGAILCLQEQDVDMVLVDMTTPDLGGLELGRWVRHSARNPNLPMIALTANAVAEIEPACRELGISTCLRKPLDYQSLPSTLNRVLAA